MKIIIDIPEEDYKGICHLKNEQLRMLPEEVAETLIRISNGTPLDDIKTEIQITITASWYNGENYKKNYRDGLDDALNIIDKHLTDMRGEE